MLNTRLHCTAAWVAGTLRRKNPPPSKLTPVLDPAGAVVVVVAAVVLVVLLVVLLVLLVLEVLELDVLVGAVAVPNPQPDTETVWRLLTPATWPFRVPPWTTVLAARVT
ncbi:MAG: hypothetical protein ACYDAD_12785, partial [Acidimicrobiales bacterium]